MGFFGRLLGVEDDANRRPAPVPLDQDGQAIERYRYMVRTAPPETLEQAYAEGFAKLTPEQRERVRAELTQSAPEAERPVMTAASPADNQALARAATRAEIRQPGAMERALGSGGLSTPGFGANLLSSFAMGFVGSMVAQSFLSTVGGFGAEAPAGDEADGGELADANAGGEDLGGLDDGGDFGGDFDV